MFLFSVGEQSCLIFRPRLTALLGVESDDHVEFYRLFIGNTQTRMRENLLSTASRDMVRVKCSTLGMRFSMVKRGRTLGNRCGKTRGIKGIQHDQRLRVIHNAEQRLLDVFKALGARPSTVEISPDALLLLLAQHLQALLQVTRRQVLARDDAADFASSVQHDLKRKRSIRSLST